MNTEVSNLLSSTTDEVVTVIGGFITDGHLGTIISVALAAGLIGFVVHKLVRKY